MDAEQGDRRSVTNRPEGEGHHHRGGDGPAQEEEMIDEWGEDSFPASDPPQSWTWEPPAEGS